MLERLQNRLQYGRFNPASEELEEQEKQLQAYMQSAEYQRRLQETNAAIAAQNQERREREAYERRLAEIQADREKSMPGIYDNPSRRASSGRTPTQTQRVQTSSISPERAVSNWYDSQRNMFPSAYENQIEAATKYLRTANTDPFVQNNGTKNIVSLSDRKREATSALTAAQEELAKVQAAKPQQQAGSYMDLMSQPTQTDDFDEEQALADFGTDYVRMRDTIGNKGPDLGAASQYARDLYKWQDQAEAAKDKVYQAEKTLNYDIKNEETTRKYEMQYATNASASAIANDIRKNHAGALRSWKNGTIFSRDPESDEKALGIYASVTGEYTLADNKDIANADLMTDSEKAVALQLFQNGDMAGFKEYTDALQPTLNERSYYKQQGQIDKAPRVAQIAAGVAGSFTGIPALVKSTTNAITGQYNDKYDPAFALDRLAGEAREKSLEGTAPIVQKLGNAAYSALDNYILAPLGPEAALITMSLNAGGKAATEAVTEGKATGWQTAALGWGNAGLEYLTEQLPFEKMFDLLTSKNIRGAKDYLLGVLGATLPEAGEEAVNNIAEVLLDRMVMGRDSKYSTMVRELEANGASHSDAVKQTEIYLLGRNTLESAEMGALSAVLMGGVSATTNAVRTAKSDRVVGRDIANRTVADVVLEEGMKSPDSRIQANAAALDAIRHENRNTEGFKWSNKQARQIGEIYDSLDKKAKNRVGYEAGVREAERELETQDKIAAREAELEAEQQKNSATDINAVLDAEEAELDAEYERRMKEAGATAEENNPEAVVDNTVQEMPQNSEADEMDRLAAAADEATRTGDTTVIDRAQQPMQTEQQPVQTTQQTAQETTKTTAQPNTPEEAGRQTANNASKAGLSAEDTLVMSNIARDIGVGLEFQKMTNARINGIYNREAGTIILNQDLSSSQMAWTTFAHEITHHSESAGGYAQVAALAKRFFTEGSDEGMEDAAWRSYVNDIRRQYMDVGFTLKKEDAEFEAVANTIESILGSRESMEAVAKYSREDAQALLASIEDVLDRTTSNNTAITPESAKLVQAQKTLAAALNEVREQRGTAQETAVESKPGDVQSEVQYSIEYDEKYQTDAEKKNDTTHNVNTQTLQHAGEDRTKVKAKLESVKDTANLPPDIAGNTAQGNSAYGTSEENTTVCPRSLAIDSLSDAVAEQLGRPLTVEESLYIAQEAFNFTDMPQCLYCYVAMDRMAKREYMGDYINKRDAVIKNLQNGMSVEEAREAFRQSETDNGKQPKNWTKAREKRFNSWVKNYQSGARALQMSDLASDATVEKAMKDKQLAAQVKDAMNYAQSASWAKKRVGYTAYNGHILNWKQSRIDMLNSMFGLRMYSFSDYSPAFVLENMQMVTDAAVRGLKMLAYTKDLDFVRVFAPTDMNINISVFGMNGKNGTVEQDGMQGANWKEAQALRAEHPNVGITFVATNDTQVEWALAQDWIDVVIPFHMVKTGAKVANIMGYRNYTSESSDRTATGKKGEIFPNEHQNDREKYFAALEKQGLEPRFKRWADNPNYMKLVNETRRSAGDTPAVQPVFNVDAAMDSIDNMVKRGGYNVPIGGDLENLSDIAEEMAGKIANGLAKDLRIRDGIIKRNGKEIPQSSKQYDIGFDENLTKASKSNAESNTFDSGDEHVQYSLRLDDPPKKTLYAYKAFYAKNGKLYPPMVSNQSDEEYKGSGTFKGNDTPVGVWLDADIGGILVDENGKPVRTKTTGRLQVQNAKAGGKEGLAFRPGWHLGEWPDAKQFNKKDPETGERKARMPDNLVFAKCEIAADKDYQLAAMRYGVNKNGRFARTQAGLPRIPVDGYYKYRTNPDPDTAPWYITGSMKVVEILDDDMAAQICAQYGIKPDKRVSGRKIDLSDYGLKAGPVTPTQDTAKYLKSETNYANDRFLRDALNDPDYADAYVQRDIDWNDPEIANEFAINRQDMEYYRTAKDDSVISEAPVVEASVSGMDFEKMRKNAIEKYGRMRSGEQLVDEEGNAVTHEEDMANSYEKGKKSRRGYLTAAEANVSDPILQDIHTRAALDQYTPKTNKDTVAAAKSIRDNFTSFQSAYEAWRSMVERGMSGRYNTFAEQVAFGQQLYLEALSEGKGKEAIEILTDISQFETALGQGVQAASILKKLSPEGELIRVKRLAQTADQRLTPKNGKKKVPAGAKTVVDAEKISDELAKKIKALRELKKLEANGEKLTKEESARIAELTDEIAAKQKELEPLKKQLEALGKERHEFAKEAGKLKREQTWLEGKDGKPGKLARLAKEIHDLDDEVMFLNAELLPKRKELQSKIADERITREERNILARELRSVNHSIEKATAQIADHQQEINTLNHNLVVRRIEMESKLAYERMTRAQRNEAAKELRHINTEIKNANQLIWEHQQDITNYMAQMNTKEATLEELQQYEQIVLSSKQIMNTYLRYVKNFSTEVDIPLDLQAAYINAKTDEEREKLRLQIDQSIAEQLPGTWAEKFRSWRYTSMLANVSTHFRNILGNIGQFSASGINDTFATAIESMSMRGNSEAYKSASERVQKLQQSIAEVSANKEYSDEYREMQLKRLRTSLAEAEQKMTKNERRHAIVAPKFDRALYSAAHDDYLQIKKDLQAGGRESETQRIQDLRTIYTSFLGRKVLEPIRKFSSNMLEREDAWFLEFSYTTAYAQYMKANGITPTTATDEQKARARTVAFEKALENTYRDASVLANKINDIEKMNPVSRFMVGAIMPFKKTPINVLKRGVEYSPLNLVRQAQDLYTLAFNKENSRTKSEMLEDFCKTLTGSALFAIGMLGQSAGWLMATPGYDDKDRDKKMEEATGQQNYAIKFRTPWDGKEWTYTFDWFAPIAMPLFAGARAKEVWDQFHSGEKDADTWADSLMEGFVTTLNPVFELSMLDGLTKLMKSYESEGSGVASAVVMSAIESMALQFIPTLGGKVEHIIDPYQRSTKVQGGSAFTKQLRQLYRRAAAKIPGVAQFALEPVVDQYGNLKENVGSNFIDKALYYLASPGYVKEVTHLNSDEEMKRLYKEMQGINPSKATSVLPKSVPTSFDLNNETYYLSEKDYTNFAQRLGQQAYAGLESLYASDEYKNAYTKQQAKMVEDVWDDAYEQAKRSYFEDIGVLEDYLRTKLDPLLYDDSTGERDYRNIEEVRRLYEDGYIDLKTVEAATSELSHISKMGDKLGALNDMKLTQDEYNFAYMTKIAGKNMQEDMQAVLDAGGSLTDAIKVVSKFYKWDDSVIDEETGKFGVWVRKDKGSMATLLADSKLPDEAVEAFYLNFGSLVPSNMVEKEQAKIDDYTSRGLTVRDYLRSLDYKYDETGEAYEGDGGKYKEILESDADDKVKEAAVINLVCDTDDAKKTAKEDIAAFKTGGYGVNEYLATRAALYDENGKAIEKTGEKATALANSDIPAKAKGIAWYTVVSDAKGAKDMLNTFCTGGNTVNDFLRAVAATSKDGMTAPTKSKAILDLPLKSYTAAIKSIVTTSENKIEGIDSLLRAGISDRTVAYGYAKYAEINARDDLNGSGKATEFSKWLDTDSTMSKLNADDKALMKDVFSYYNMVRADAGRYDNLMKINNMTSTVADSISSDIAALKPLEGTKTVSDAQKIGAIAVNKTATDAQKDSAIGQIFDSSDDGNEAAKLTAYKDIRNSGVSIKTFADFYSATSVMKSDKDANGKDIKGRSRQDKIWAYINSLPISRDQKDKMHCFYYKDTTLKKTPWH